MLRSCGFSLRILVPDSSGLPPVNSAIYVLWNESEWDEPPGWYYAVVSEYHSDGEATIEYADKATELVNLISVEWKHTRKGQKPFLPVFRTLWFFRSKRFVKMWKDLSIVCPLLTLWKDMPMIFQCFPPILVNISLSSLTSLSTLKTWTSHLDRISVFLWYLMAIRWTVRPLSLYPMAQLVTSLKLQPKFLASWLQGHPFWQNKQWLPS